MIDEYFIKAHERYLKAHKELTDFENKMNWIVAVSSTMVVVGVVGLIMLKVLH
jgi:hypothetical protein